MTRLAYTDALAADMAVHRSFARLIVEAVDYFGTCYLRHEFSSDDVREFVEVNYPGATPHHGNVIGAVMRHLSDTDRIAPVGVTTSARPEARGRMIRTWRVVPKPPVGGRGPTPAPPTDRA